MNNRIEHEAGNPDAWICRCGNRPDADGFYPCDEAGNVVEPTREAWKTCLYVCARCGVIICTRCGVMIDRTLDIVGQADPAVVQSQL